MRIAYEQDERLVREYAKHRNISVSEAIRESIIEKIENEYDLECYEKVMQEYSQDETTYSLNEVEKELGL